MTNDVPRFSVKPHLGAIESERDAHVSITLSYDCQHHEEISKKKVAIFTYTNEATDWTIEHLNGLIKSDPQNVVKHEFKICIERKKELFEIPEERESVFNEKTIAEDASKGSLRSIDEDLVSEKNLLIDYLLSEKNRLQREIQQTAAARARVQPVPGSALVHLSLPAIVVSCLLSMAVGYLIALV